MPPTAEPTPGGGKPPAPKPGYSNPLTRKLGPAPVWVWVAAAAGLYLAYRYLAGGTSPASAVAPATGAPTTTNGSGAATDSGAGGGGGATALDSLPADLIAELFGTTAQINGQLTDALINSSGVIAGLGSEALAENGAIEQSILDKFNAPQPAATVATAPASFAPIAPAAAPAPSRTSSPSNASASFPVMSFQPEPPPASSPPIYPAVQAAFDASTSAPSSAPAVRTQAAPIASGSAGVQKKQTTTNFQAKRQL